MTTQTPAIAEIEKNDSGSNVKRNFWPQRNFWPVITFQLFCLWEQRNEFWQLLFWCVLCKL